MAHPNPRPVSPILVFALALAALVGGASAPAGATDAARPVPVEAMRQMPADACNRSATLDAAKAALARGDREGAIEHLRAAEALLDACSRSLGPSAPGDEEQEDEVEAALAFAVPAAQMRSPASEPKRGSLDRLQG